jgi:hypothetical protein
MNSNFHGLVKKKDIFIDNKFLSFFNLQLLQKIKNKIVKIVLFYSAGPVRNKIFLKWVD